MGGAGEAAAPDWISKIEIDAWTGRPFARTFDLISSQYGWCDEQILTLTLGRFRQIRDVIFERQGEDRRRTLHLEEAKVKTLASFMAQNEKAARQVKQIMFVEPPAGEPVAAGKRVGMIPFERVGAMFGG